MGTPMPAAGPTQTWLFELEQIQHSLDTLMRLLGSLSFQLKQTGKDKKMVLHALSKQDLPDMKELPDSLDVLLGLIQLLSAQIEETENKKHFLKKKQKKNKQVAALSVRLQGLEKKKLAQKDDALSEESDDHLHLFPALLCMDKLPDSIQGLLGLLGSLTAQVKRLENKKQAVLNALSKFHSATSEVSEIKSDVCPTTEDVVIVFVEEIEKANQYLDFEEYLKKENLAKPGDDAFKVLKNLVCQQKVHELPQFNKLDFQQILDVVHGCIWNLKIERHAHGQFMQCYNSSKAFPDTENDWYSLMWPQEVCVGGLMEPLLSLVYHIREKGHVMDENPLVELSFMINFSDMFYKVCIFHRLLQKYSENSVLVLSPLAFEEADIKAELSVCGKIESFRFERSGTSRVGTAHVTFENSVAAKIAPLLSGWKSRLIINPTIEEDEYQPKEIAEYCRAMTKYREFRNYSKKMSN